LSTFENLLQEAEKQGWRTALTRTLEGDALDRAAHPERAAFIQLLPVKPQGEILELGAGWGGITLELARSGFGVIALEKDPARSRFIAIRAKQEGMSDRIESLQGDRIPASRFDAIVLHQPASSADLPLKELRERLAPGGLLYLGGRNRLGWNRSGRGDGGLTYAEYKRRFAAAGLRIQRAYVSPRGFLNPSELVPLQTRAIRHYTRMRLEPQKNLRGLLKNMIKSLLARPVFWKWFGPDFVFFLEAADA
jgi:hypothetical protein